MDTWMMALVAMLALPRVGLSSIFVVCFVSATLLPVGSEAAVYGFLRLNPHMFWAAVLVATAGNTVGGMVTYWMGYGVEKAYEHKTHHKPHHARVLLWLERFGAKTCLLSWLPFVGDPLCAVAGWLRLPFWPCVMYMTIGKFGRYLVMSATLLWFFPG